MKLQNDQTTFRRVRQPRGPLLSQRVCPQPPPDQSVGVRRRRCRTPRQAIQVPRRDRRVEVGQEGGGGAARELVSPAHARAVAGRDVCHWDVHDRVSVVGHSKKKQVLMAQMYLRSVAGKYVQEYLTCQLKFRI
jgi:hypothetical protein